MRLDRLARSVSHLLEVIERLEAKGAHFRSLCDPIDTSTPQGMFTLQVLGAVAQLERALISERTKAGINAARARGKLPGNPGLRAKDPTLRDNRVNFLGPVGIQDSICSLAVIQALDGKIRFD